MRIPSLIGAGSMAIPSRSDLVKRDGVIINEHILTASERKPRQRREPLVRVSRFPTETIQIGWLDGRSKPARKQS
jgi:hypothetical protein